MISWMKHGGGGWECDHYFGRLNSLEGTECAIEIRHKDGYWVIEVAYQGDVIQLKSDDIEVIKEERIDLRNDKEVWGSLYITWTDLHCRHASWMSMGRHVKGIL